MTAGRVIDAGLHLLDRQVLDSNGRMAGTVDDLELEMPDGGGAPVVVAILSGPGALGPRIGGRLGAALAAIPGRLASRQDGRPARIPWSLVKNVGSDIEVSVPHDELESNYFEAWVAVHVIGKIPGAKRALE